MKVFLSLDDAIKAGYQTYDRWEHGYIVRTRTAAGWALAIVDLNGNRRLPPAKELDFDALTRGGDPEC